MKNEELFTKKVSQLMRNLFCVLFSLFWTVSNRLTKFGFRSRSRNRAAQDLALQNRVLP
jgi:hypothetical protein